MFCPNCGTQLAEENSRCPRCGQHFQIQQITPISTKKKRTDFFEIIDKICKNIVVIVICIFVFGFIYFFKNNFVNNNFQNNEFHNTPPAPEMQTEASQLVKAYEMSGGALMKRCISVNGIVDHIETNSNEFIVVLNAGVRCIMDAKVHFAKGQHVILAGTVSAYRMGGVDLKGCRVLGEGPVPQGRTAGDAPEVSLADAVSSKSSQEEYPENQPKLITLHGHSISASSLAKSVCAKITSWDAWFNASKSFRKEHPECRPHLSTLQAPTISADRLAMEYGENEVAAEEAYKNRILIVTGKVRSIETDMSGNPRIWLQTKSGYGVLCGLAYSQRRSVATLRKGQTISIVGKIGMAVMRRPTVDDAILLNE